MREIRTSGSVGEAGLERQRASLNGHGSGNVETDQGSPYRLNTRLYPANLFRSTYEMAECANKTNRRAVLVNSRPAISSLSSAGNRSVASVFRIRPLSFIICKSS